MMVIIGEHDREVKSVECIFFPANVVGSRDSLPSGKLPQLFSPFNGRYDCVKSLKRRSCDVQIDIEVGPPEHRLNEGCWL